MYFHLKSFNNKLITLILLSIQLVL